MRSEIVGGQRGRARRRPGTLRFAGRAARKAVVTTIGATVAVAGVALLVLPGPGLLVVGLGLGILSTEYRWPARLSRWLRDEASSALAHLRGRLAERRHGQRSPDRSPLTRAPTARRGRR